MIFSLNITLAGDTPCAATSLMPNMVAFAQFNTTGNSGSNLSAPTCGNYSGTDFWFEVTVGPSGRLCLISKDLGLLDGAMAVYRGSCQTPELIGCFSDAICGNTNMPITTFYDLTSGERIFILFQNH